MPQTDMERLVYQVSADLTALKKGQADMVGIVRDGARKGAKEVEAAGQGLMSKFFGHPAEVDKAIEGIFSRSRLAVLEEGGARIPIFGAALEALGPAGLAGAAGLAAIALSGEEARKAMEWADDLEKTAKTLGVTTDYLQEFDYAAIASSIGVQKGREGLQEFNTVLGKYSSGLAPGKVGKFLDALGFTPESARQITDVGAALDQVLKKLATLPNQSQRAGVAKSLGLESFLPIVSEGSEGIDRFIAKMHEAQSAGGVVSASDIKQAAELNDQVEALTYLIKQEFRAAFVELAPTIEKVAEFMEILSRNVAHFIAQIPDAIRGMEEMAKHAPKMPGGGRDSGFLGDLWHGAAELEDKTFGWRAIRNFAGDATKTGWAARMKDQIGDSMLTGHADFSLAKGPENRPGADLKDHSAENAAAARKAEEERRRAIEKATRSMEAVDAATKDELNAHAALVTDIEQRAVLAADEVDADNKRKNDKLRGDAAAGKIDAAQAARAVDLNNIAAAEKKQKIAGDAEAALAEQRLQQSATINGYYDQMLQITASMARTLGERRDAELRLLASQRKQELARIENDRANELRGVDAKAPNAQGQRDAINSGKDAERAAAIDAADARVRQTIQDTKGPLDAWKDDTLKNAAEVQEALEKAGVKGFDAFNDGVANAIANGESLGDVMHSVFAQMEADLIKYLLKQAEIAAFGGTGSAGVGATGLFSTVVAAFTGKPAAPPLKFASGGLVPGSGGPTSDTVPALLSPGEFVLSNTMMRNLEGQRSAAAAPGELHVHVDVSGANGDAAVASIARQAALEGTAQAIAYTNGRFASAASRQRNALGSRR